MKTVIKSKTYDEERALYHLQDATVEDCTFAGPADGESALKESRNITVRRCHFSLRYPLWHAQGFTLENSTMDTLTRAALWYSRDGKVTGCTLDGIKCLRECERITLQNDIIHSPEFGWRCRQMTVADVTLESEYAFFETVGGEMDHLNLCGKYSFQYTQDILIENAVLDTKDAFWHSRNVTVKNSVIKGEYLGWYSQGLTLIGCHIDGTQPLCYCDRLRLIDCTMENTDLSFEYADVQATVKGEILSVKNPRHGYIRADRIGKIITEDAVMDTDCLITENLPAK